MVVGATEFVDNTISQDVFSPPVWSKEVLTALETKLVFAPRTNRVYEADAKVGYKVNVPSVGNLAARAKAENTALSFETIAEAVTAITINKWYYAAFGIEDLVKLQSQVDLRSKYQAKCGYALAKQIDTDIAALIQSFTPTVGTLGVNLTDDDFLTALQKLQEADVDMDNDIFVVISPNEHKNLMTLDKYTNSLYRDSKPMENGKIGNVYGAEWAVSNNLHKPVAGQGDNAVFWREGLALVMQQEPRTQTFYDLNYLTWKIAADVVYGCGVMRAGAGIYAKGKA